MNGLKTDDIKAFLSEGTFGLELESHRITRDGHLSHVTHPFPGDPNIVRDFSEDQVEINTTPERSPQAVRDQLAYHLGRVQKKLASMEKPELLWPFSNPPYILNEEDIHIAQWYGEERASTEYREYLADRYGRYKMTYSGIHFNYSFGEETLRRLAAENSMEYSAFRSQFYLDLAEKVAAYGWLLVVLMAASPVADRSLIERGKIGSSVFQGLSSPRCSEFGYWNHFSPIFNYNSITDYVAIIRQYVGSRLLKASRELYYPVRIKPYGKYTLEGLQKGISHIELRMIDLNPLDPYGIALDDIRFLELFLLWLAQLPTKRMRTDQQVQTVQNYKNASHYDLDLARITLLAGRSESVREASETILRWVYEYFQKAEPEQLPVIQKQIDKITSEDKRYAAIVLRQYGENFVEKGLKLAIQRQEEQNV